MVTSKPAPRDLIATAPISESLRLLAQAGDVRRYAKGTLLIGEGDDTAALFVILAGRLRAFSANLENAREITYGVYDPGEYVGEMSLDGGKRSANVMAIESAICARIERPTLIAHVAKHPEFAFELISKVIQRARAATVGLREVALNDVYGRLKHLLETLAVKQPDGTQVIEPTLTHRDMAQRLGCGREMVSRLMKDLERGGYVGVETGRLVVLRKLAPKW